MAFRIIPTSQTGLQTDIDVSFIGGKPRIPLDEAIPKCSLCENEMAFFFQTDFPHQNPWHGNTLALFSCISCTDRNYLIPEMLKGRLLGINVTQEFLQSP
jgi:hypothetical protein